MKIGIFDSGQGGQFALAHFQKLFPAVEFVGFFDSSNAPYGDRTADEIYELSRAGLLQLWNQNVDLSLVACNTAAAQALRRVQENYPQHKTLGCLIPAIESAVEAGGRNIGLIATAFTIQSKKYHREAFKVNPKANLVTQATPELVPWIEASQQDSLACRQYLKQVVGNLQTKKIDSLILGCTHYHSLKPFLAQTFPHLKIIDSVEAQGQKLRGYLKRHPEIFTL